MLSESSYHWAMYAYTGSALVALVYLGWWLRRSWRPTWIALAVLVGAALFLTPAYPGEGVTTLAPALIVAVFGVMTGGLESAQHALRPLAFMVGLAITLSGLLWLLLFRRSGNQSQSSKVPGKQETQQ